MHNRISVEIDITRYIIKTRNVTPSLPFQHIMTVLYDDLCLLAGNVYYDEEGCHEDYYDDIISKVESDI